MIFNFFPPVALKAAPLEKASLLVRADEGGGRPVVAELSMLKVEDMGLSSEVLPVVRVIALGLVVLLVEQAPLSLKVKHVEVLILFHGVDYPGLQVAD